MEKNIVIVGSRSGGHILPGLAKGREAHAAGNKVYFIAEDRPLDHSLIEREPWLAGCYFMSLNIPCVRTWWKYPRYGLSLLAHIVRLMLLLRRWNTSRVVGMGGYSSVPVCCAAFLLRIPYELHEFNAELGRAVYWLRHKADAIVCCFPEALKDVPARAQQLGAYPVRYKAQDSIDCSHARSMLGLLPHRFTLSILGGSQGSQALNMLIISWLKTVPVEQRSLLQIVHQTGAQPEHVRNFYKEYGVSALVFDYADDLIPFYCAADVMVTRAGAGALHEVMHFQKRALIIPLETAATHHQVSNAQAIQQRDPQRWTMIRQGVPDQIYAFLHDQLPKD